MYAETGLLYPYFQSFSQDVQNLEDFCEVGRSNFPMGNMLSSTTSLEYDMGGEGDLFKSPELIIEEQLMGLDIMSDTISMLSNGNNDIHSQAINVVDMEAIQNESLLNEVLYECEKDILANSSIGKPFSEDPSVKITFAKIDEDPIAELDRFISDRSIQNFVDSRSLEDPVEELSRFVWEKSSQNRVGYLGDPNRKKDMLLVEDLKHKSVISRGFEDPIEDKDRLIMEDLKQKSVSFECLSSMEWVHKDVMRPNFSDFNGMDFEAANGMRRAFSEGDIPGLNNINYNVIHSPFERIGNYSIEERLQSLSRYRIKKAKRNFGRTIKYACRKALADNQPRVRGRFAKTEESAIPKKPPCVVEEGRK